ncbi:hypothetical protein PPERSA_00685 [Pseudocohnilembus persalinus]|uniref:EF-hand domain-containing protein n=1 Tax=Pseudocohnilembus persalinus TaxID=266149 RepID=A0A0V0QTY5_PSEPJ|nr:hypothetical protein PPERSA_00685 [Pseudocohnilembus persalinus]|eukprot:KRX05384.1 hypothetical protein PPERSA_00685 [Pseudocohnilembus persalinus]
MDKDQANQNQKESYEDQENYESFQPLCSIEEAKEIAREIFKKYDYDQTGQLKKGEIGPMMIDIYKGLQIMFNPSIHDVESFANVVDTNGDHKITLEDLEKCAIKYLTNTSDRI